MWISDVMLLQYRQVLINIIIRRQGRGLYRYDWAKKNNSPLQLSRPHTNPGKEQKTFQKSSACDLPTVHHSNIVPLAN